MKKFLVVLMSATIVLSSTIVSLAGEWKQTGKGWKYDNGNGNYTISNWQQIDNKWYHFNQDGDMSHNTWIDGKYYVGADGAMYADATTPDGKKLTLLD
ncbi:MAG: hypothetical protein E7250_10150 [Paenibacillaceae bacterium]|nr:hypothetical protein [Paenibacillaceae bacterium]